jgi:pyruvate/2-oxoglutarate dehydrogenase complex dihydrolipoamide acyltransferase (E2) component
VILVLGQLSLGMEEGRVVRWIAGDGDAVRAGDVVCEVEIDKAVADVEAPAAGRLRIVAAVGETVPVGATLAEIDEGGAP